MSDDLAGQTVICPVCLVLVRVPGGAAPLPVAKKLPSPAVPIKPVKKPVPPAIMQKTALKAETAPPRTATPKPFPSPVEPPAPRPEARQWFYELKGKPCGPVGEADLAVLAREDRVFPYTLVWCESQIRWQPAGGVLPRLFKGVDADDLFPPTAVWQRFTAYTLLCVAMAAVMAAAVTFALKERKKATQTAQLQSQFKA